MFTGIIREVGIVAEAKRVGGGAQLTIDAPATVPELAIHDSVAVNGVCLTVTAKSSRTFSAEAVEETLRKTTLGGLRSSARVNLELALKVGERFGGHIVQGHVDGIGTVTSTEKKESSWLITVEFPQDFARYIIPVGSIAVDGISLTVASIRGNIFVVSIIPHTMEHTCLADRNVGSAVNLEVDLVGKYVESLLKHAASVGEGISVEKLREWGYSV